VRPRLELLDSNLISRVLEEAFELLETPGVKVASPVARTLLADAGARVEDGIARIPAPLVEQALASAPKEFWLYSRTGERLVHYGGDTVQFDPGSSCLNILDPETERPRSALAADLVRMVRVAEMLPEYSAQATAMVCNDVPQEIGDFYRLFLVLAYSNKPVITGAFSAPTLNAMLKLLAADSGGALNRDAPRAIFDVCPSPPLNWSEFASENLVQLARAGVPAEIVSMPLAGATAPVTLIGSVVQHAAECLSGIAIHQLAHPGAPIVWGGAPSIFDMTGAGTPMGAIETAMLNCACTQVGKSLGMPTHGYMVATESHLVDAQAGMESSMSAVMGALAGINMISGAGMLDSLACHSVEKLVIDAEAIASAMRLVRGIEPRSEHLATHMFAEIGLSGEFLKLKDTRTLFRSEQHFPSSVIERGDASATFSTTFERARDRVEELLNLYIPPSPPQLEALQEVALHEADRVGLCTLPGLGSELDSIHSV
jgi:trimethylamine---corrinoid protein Co-methyltransferase